MLIVVIVRTVVIPERKRIECGQKNGSVSIPERYDTGIKQVD